MGLLCKHGLMSGADCCAEARVGLGDAGQGYPLSPAFLPSASDVSQGGKTWVLHLAFFPSFPTPQGTAASHTCAHSARAHTCAHSASMCTAVGSTAHTWTALK